MNESGLCLRSLHYFCPQGPCNWRKISAPGVHLAGTPPICFPRWSTRPWKRPLQYKEFNKYFFSCSEECSYMQFSKPSGSGCLPCFQLCAQGRDIPIPVQRPEEGETSLDWGVEKGFLLEDMKGNWAGMVFITNPSLLKMSRLFALLDFVLSWDQAPLPFLLFLPFGMRMSVLCPSYSSSNVPGRQG